MSASRERKKRMELAEVGQSPKQLKAAAEKKKKTKSMTLGIIAVVLVLAIAIGCFYGLQIRPNLMPRKTVALRTGDHELSAVDFGYYYYDAINSFYQNYGSYLSYLMTDPTLPLNEAVYDEESGQTWADYFIEGAGENAKFDYACYDAAMKDGYQLSAEGEKSIQDGIAELEVSVKENGFKSLDQYFTQVYGKGSSKESYEAYQRLHLTASEYSEKIDKERTYTDEQISTKEAENPNQYSNVTYRSFYIGASNYQTADTTTEEEKAEMTEEETAAAEKEAAADKEKALASAKADADSMTSAVKGDEGKFAEMALELATEASKETYEDPDATLHSDEAYSNVASYLVEWLYDDARQNGDVATIADDGSGYYVVYYISENDNHYNMVNVRHILLEPENDEDSDGDGEMDTASETSIAAAKAEAEKVLAEWRAGDATEESFAALADEKSSDTAEGGLYEGVYHGMMVTEFNDWCFDEARKPGDVDIVQTQYGAHIIYFIGEGDDYRQSMIINDLKKDDYTTWSEEIVKGYDATQEAAGTAYLRTDLVLGSDTAANQPEA